MEFLVTGLALGGLYALVAQAFVLTFITTRTLNFGVGEVMAIGAFVALGTMSWSSMPVPLRLAFAVVAAGVTGPVIYRWLILPFTGHGPHDIRWLLSSVGCGIVVLNVLENSQGTSPRSLGMLGTDATASVFGARVGAQLLIIALVAIVVTLALAAGSARTPSGVMMRAVSEDPDTAALMGVSPRWVGAAAYAVAMAIAGLAGVLWSADVGVSTALGAPLLVAAFAVAVIGGLTSFYGPLVGGALYGVLTQFAAWEWGSVWGETAGLLLVIAVLMWRPEGLLGRRVEEKV